MGEAMKVGGREKGPASVNSKIMTQMAANALEQGATGEQQGDLQLPGPSYWICF